MTIDPQNVKHERKKLRRMVHNVYKGLTTKDEVYEQIRSWEAHLRKGNTNHVIKRTREYLKQLWESEKNVTYTAKTDAIAAGGQRIFELPSLEIQSGYCYSKFTNPVYRGTKRYRNPGRIYQRGGMRYR